MTDTAPEQTPPAPEAALFEQIAEEMAAHFELERDEITPEARLREDLDFDSIDAIDVLKRVERMTGQRVDPEVLEDVQTVADVVALVQRLGARRSEA